MMLPTPRSIHNDEYCKQILSSAEYIHYDKDVTIKLIFADRVRLCLLVFLVLTSQSHALPISQGTRPMDGVPHRCSSF